MAKYINDERLTDQVIEEILNKCGLELVKTKEDYMTGKTVQVQNIIRNDDYIIVSCINKEMQDFADIIASRMPIFGMLSRGGAYMPGEEIITIDDFFAQRLKMSEEIETLDQKLFDTYHETMCSLFGKEYEKDASAEFERIRAEEANKENQTNEKDEQNESSPENAPEMGE